DDLTTSTVDDSTSNGNDGTKVAANHPAEGSGYISKGQFYADSTSYYINSGTASSLNTTNSFTISGWMNFTDFGTGLATPFEALMWKGDGNTDSTINYFAETAPGSVMRVGYAVSGSYKILDSTVALSSSRWYFITGTYDGTSNVLSLYIDGDLNTSGVQNADPSTNTSPLTIGSCSVSGNCDNMTGTIDEVHISNVARSAGWVKTEYNNQLSPSSFVALGGRQSQGRISYTSSSSVSTAPAYKIRGGVKFR
ncbi:MAG TPA: LamG domain-containing protein, partial [Candidatus Paceibacterota bacterium]|nr:LamG domain-containing protein [Candidatus Paceibacterota bacterium]